TSSRRRSRRRSQGMDSVGKTLPGRAPWPSIPPMRNSRNLYCRVYRSRTTYRHRQRCWSTTSRPARLRQQRSFALSPPRQANQRKAGCRLTAGTAPCAPALDLFLRQRTFALVERTPRLLRRNGRELLVVVPGRLALLGLFHLEQVHRMDLAPIDAHVALAHEPVLGRQLLHLRDHRLAVGVTAERLDRAQVVDHGRVDSDHGIARHAAERREVFARECPIGVVLVPVPGIGEDEALGGLEP